jgi:hypothetical protein
MKTILRQGFSQFASHKIKHYGFYHYILAVKKDKLGKEDKEILI